MAIRLITGVPGTGKTYLSLNILLEDYFKFNRKTKQYEKQKDVTVITNIDELKLDHINLNEAIKKSGGSVEKFFSNTYQEKIHKKYKNVVYFIDECQQFFPTRFRNQEVFFFFEYHRHYGFDIYLITQDKFKITKEIALLAELEYRAVKRTLSLLGELKYNILSDREIINRKVLRPKKAIFDLYKSANVKETKKIKNPLVKVIVILLIGVVVSGYFFKKRMLRSSENPVEKEIQEKVSKTISKSTVQPDQYPAHAPKLGIHKYYEIQNKIYLNNKLYKILDPFTNTLIPPQLFPYNIRRINKKIYAMIPQNKLDELTNFDKIGFAQTSTKNKPSVSSHFN